MATKYNLLIEQGSTLSKSFYFYDASKISQDLTGYTANAQIRPSKTSDTLILDLTEANGRIVMDKPNGIITLSLDSDVTTNLDFDSAMWDMEIIQNLPSGPPFVRRILEGRVILSKEVTR